MPLAPLLLAAALTAAPGARPAEPLVFDTRRGAVSSQAALFDAAAGADVVFVGELHDDKAAHRLELQLLQALAAKGRPVVLVMEMFERDVQPALDAYAKGELDEAAMLARSRPWSNYKEDYRPLVELALAQDWPVVAGNMPRPLASKVAREGLGALEALPPAERANVAAELDCPPGPYRDKFMAEMKDMAGHGGKGAPPNLDRLFESQCAKDETMAESVASRLKPGATVVHVNGAFHSDEGLGTVERLRRRRPDARVLVVSIGRGAAPSSAHRALGDFVVWTP
jgi:uncharacterized iron-regulated protein